MKRDGRGERRRGGGEERRRGQRGGRQREGGGEGGGGRSEGGGEEGRRQRRLHQVLCDGATLLFVVWAVFGFTGFSCHSVLVPPAGDVLFELDLRVDVDVTDLAVEGFVLETRALQGGAAAVLQFSAGSGVGFDWSGAAPSLQHRFVF